MALEHLSLAPNAVEGVTNGVNGRPASTDGASGGGDDGSKTPRLPRWTRQEILVLIQGKKVAENRVRRGGRTAAGFDFGSGQVEPKWASVSSYCKRHGVNRGPVQCRKRWSNLAGDFKKIKEWELQIREETDSFWVMRNDLRRERKLPGFFDKEVYDILDSGSGIPPCTGLALALTSSAPAVEEEEAIRAEPVFDSEKTAAADDGLFSDDSEQDETGRVPDKDARSKAGSDPVHKPSAIPTPQPISEKLYQPVVLVREGTANEKQPTSNPERGSTSHDGKKRKRVASDGDDEDILQNQLIDILEKNGKMLTAQLEAQNNNSQLDREQRKDHADSLVAVLNKLADALGRIADKL